VLGSAETDCACKAVSDVTTVAFPGTIEQGFKLAAERCTAKEIPDEPSIQRDSDTADLTKHGQDTHVPSPMS
jgi:hypothetical protein